ncbi:bacteriophage holin [Natrarchaeobius oligotrophus]|nr:bacteriophage holin [Natrarchaeobius chitinivorans]
MQSQTRRRESKRSAVSSDDRSGRLDPLAFGFALGTTMAASVGFVGVVSRLGWARRWRVMLADLYPGFEEERGGTASGIAWGGLDGFAAGVTVAWLYNVFRRE